MRTSTLLRIFILLPLVACSADENDSGVINTGVERDMQVVDRGVILADLSGMTQDSGISEDQGRTEPEDAGVELDAMTDAGVVVDIGGIPVDGSVTPEDAATEPEPPMCGNAGPACDEACRWLADCALAGACELDDTDRPLLLEICQRTCANTPAYGELICGHNSCEQTLMLARNDSAFASICRGEAPPEMLDPVVEQCTEFNRCLGMCQGNQACVNQCRAVTPQPAQQRFDAIITCVQANNCITPLGMIDQPCLDANCGDQMERCFGPQVRPEGMGTCNELLSCLPLCDDGDNACVRRCIESTSPESYELYEAALGCVQENCMGGDNDCQREQCAVEIDACVDDGRPVGENRCGQVRTCFWACAGDADMIDACRRDCIDTGTLESQRIFNTFLQCAGAAMCIDQAQCELACPMENDACTQDQP